LLSVIEAVPRGGAQVAKSLGAHNFVNDAQRTLPYPLYTLMGCERNCPLEHFLESLIARRLAPKRLNANDIHSLNSHRHQATRPNLIASPPKIPLISNTYSAQELAQWEFTLSH